MKPKLKFTTIQTKHIEAIVGRDEMKLAAFHDGRYNPKDFVLISIQNYDDEMKLKSSHKKFKRSIHLRINDVQEPTMNCGKMIYPIEPIQIKELVEFILKNKNEKFFIHCEWGVSRSAGIALAIECILSHRGNLDSLNRTDNPIANFWRYTPNLHIRDKLIEYYNKTKSPFEEVNCFSCGAILDETTSVEKNGQNYDICPLCYNDINGC